MKLSQTQHPFYPSTWLSKPQAQAFMQEHGFGGVRVTAAWCKANGVNVASTGHVGASSLQYALDMMRSRQAQAERDLRGV